MLAETAIDVSLTLTCPVVVLQRHEARLISTTSLQISRRRTACSRPCHEYGGQQLPQPLGRAVCTHLKHSPPSDPMFHASAGGARVCCASTVPRCAPMVILIDTACARPEQLHSSCAFAARRAALGHRDYCVIRVQLASWPILTARHALVLYNGAAAGRESSASKSASNAARIPPSTTPPRGSRSCSSARQICT